MARPSNAATLQPAVGLSLRLICKLEYDINRVFKRLFVKANNFPRLIYNSYHQIPATI
jgi:hypothetical protein